jgi:phosphoglycolate phosphatase
VSLEQALRHLLPAASDETAAAAAAAFRAAYTAVRAGPDGGEPLFPGIAAALDRIEATGALLGVVTGMARRPLVDLLGRHGLAGRFVTLQSADDGRGKPAPDMVLRAIAAVGADAASTIVVGDTTFDVEMARNARVPAIGVAWGHHSPLLLKRAGADRIATMPAELPRLVAELLPEERMRRVYKEVSVVEGEGGFEVRLDGRPLRTPARRPLACRPGRWPLPSPPNGTSRARPCAPTACR